MENTTTLGKIKDPKIPNGIYPTNDTIISMTVDVTAIFNAQDQDGVIKSVFFDDNRDNDRPRRAPEYTSNGLKNSFITWVGVVKNIKIGENRKDQVLIYDISDNPAMLKRNPYIRPTRTYQNAVGVDRPIKATDYTIKFWVWDNKRRKGKGFEIDPKISMH